MRLLHVINTMDPASGGTAEVVRIYLRNARASQAIATLDRSTDPWIAESSAETFCFGPGRGKYGYSTALRQWLVEHAREFDAMIVHGLWQHHGVAARLAARRSSMPYFVFPHGMLDPFFHQNSPFKRLKKAAYWPVESAVLRDAAAVIFTAEDEKQSAEATFRLKCNSRIVPLGVARPEISRMDREIFLEHFPEVRGKTVVLFLGRIHPKKGIEHLVEAFAKHSRDNLHLVVAGPFEDQAYASQLRGQIEARGMTAKTTFTGLISGSVKFGALQAANVFVLPSHQENFGIAVAEALAFGVPVLISNKVNIWREIEQDGAGWAAADNTEGTTQLLGRWLALSEAERSAMAARARACFERQFRAEAAADKFLETLRECGVR